MTASSSIISLIFLLKEKKKEKKIVEEEEGKEKRRKRKKERKKERGRRRRRRPRRLVEPISSLLAQRGDLLVFSSLFPLSLSLSLSFFSLSLSLLTLFFLFVKLKLPMRNLRRSYTTQFMGRPQSRLGGRICSFNLIVFSRVHLFPSLNSVHFVQRRRISLTLFTCVTCCFSYYFVHRSFA